MAGTVPERHLPALLGTAGKAIAAMPEGPRVVAQMRRAATREDFLFLLRSADIGVADPAREMVTKAASEQWEDVRGAIVRSAELQLHERFSANA